VATAYVLASLALLPLLGLLATRCVRDPSWVLAGYAAVVPFGSAIRVPGAGTFGSLSTLLGVLAIAAFAAHLVSRTERPVPLGPVPALWVLFAGAVTATAVWSLDATVTLQQVLVLASLVGLYVVVALTRVDGKSVSRFESGVVTGGALVGGYAMYLAATGVLAGAVDQRFVAVPGGSEEGEVGDPNITAASLVLPLVVAIDRALRPGPASRRSLHAAVAMVVVVAIFLTGSRGGLLGVIAGLMVLLRRMRRPTSAAVVVLVPALAVAAAFVVAPPYVVERVTGDTRSSGRTDIWRIGLHACPHYCLQGSGWGTFAYVHEQGLLEDPTARGLRHRVEAHSVWLGTLVEGGIVALTLLVFALAVTARELLRLPRTVRAPPLAAFVALLVTNTFLHTLAFKYFWLVLIYGVLTMTAARPSPERRPPLPQTASATGRG
jgi:hypothetical protein